MPTHHQPPFFPSPSTLTPALSSPARPTLKSHHTTPLQRGAMEQSSAPLRKGPTINLRLPPPTPLYDETQKLSTFPQVPTRTTEPKLPTRTSSSAQQDTIRNRPTVGFTYSPSPRDQHTCNKTFAETAELTNCRLRTSRGPEPRNQMSPHIASKSPDNVSRLGISQRSPAYKPTKS